MLKTTKIAYNASHLSVFWWYCFLSVYLSVSFILTSDKKSSYLHFWQICQVCFRFFRSECCHASIAINQEETKTSGPAQTQTTTKTSLWLKKNNKIVLFRYRINTLKTHATRYHNNAIMKLYQFNYRFKRETCNAMQCSS